MGLAQRSRRLGASVRIAFSARAIRASVRIANTARTLSISIGTKAAPVFVALLRESRTTYLLLVVGLG